MISTCKSLADPDYALPESLGGVHRGGESCEFVTPATLRYLMLGLRYKSNGCIGGLARTFSLFGCVGICWRKINPRYRKVRVRNAMFFVVSL